MLQLIAFLAFVGCATSGSIPHPSLHGSSQMIINGSPVSISSFPYQLKLVYFGAPRCGASIIHNDWVLTAAHCVQGLTPFGLSVVSELGFTIPIQTIEMHPGYIVGHNTSPNDIAVLKLAPHYQDLTSYAVAVADGTNDFTGNTCIISGYGLTEGGYAPFRLRAAYVNVLSEWQCEYARTIYNFLANHVCVQGLSFPGTGACNSKKTSPIMTELKKRKSQKDQPSVKRADQNESTKNTRVKSTLGRIKESQSKGLMHHVMTGCKIILAILIVPPFLNYAALQRESTVLKPEGELYDVGWGQKLFLSCKGKGPPSVILDAPTGMNSDAWSLIVDKVAKLTRVCTYDRAGLGFSERPFKNSSLGDSTDSKTNYRNKWTPFTAERMVEDLHQLIAVSSDQPKPFILVGAELGALVAQFYAHMFEGDVSSLILVNPLTEDLFKQDEGIWVQNWFGHLIPSYQTVQLGAALGLTRFAIMVGLLQYPMYMSKSISDETVTRQKYLMCQPRHLSSVVDEHYFINETFSQLRTARMIRSLAENISVTVITGNYYDEQMPGPLNKAWAKSEQHLITHTYPNSQHIVVNGGDRHMLYQNPDAVIEPIKKAVRLWRNKYGKERDS